MADAGRFIINRHRILLETKIEAATLADLDLDLGMRLEHEAYRVPA